MPVLQLDDQQFPLNAGATRIGAGTGADITVPGYSALGVDAIIDSGPRPTIRRADETAHVRVNGVLLGAEPTPLMHGDKVEIAGLELRFADDAKGGATQFVSASEIAAMAGAKRSGAARATAASGGRVVSLVDGKEYTIADAGLVFGRDASCDVVIPQNEVSRRHAEIVPGDQGYMVRDTSANGIFLNGDRVQGSQKLSRSDVLRIGSEEFRFYADVLAPSAARVATPPSAAAAVPPSPLAAMPPSEVAGLPDLDLLPDPEPVAPVAAVPAVTPPEPPRAPERAPVPVSETPKFAPVAVTPRSSPATPDPRAVLAVLEWVNEGPGKGTKYELRTPLGHVGRGAHNDVRLSDESVSETHAKLQKREDGWYVVDMDSTNGTYVGGSRVIGDKRLEGSPDVRFGGMKFRFSALGAGSAADVEAKGTRAIAAMGRPSASAASQATAKAPVTPAPTPAPTPAAPTPVTPPAATGGGGISAWVWIVVVLVIAGVAFFLLKGQA